MMHELSEVILGIGVDLVDARRISRLIHRFGCRFLGRYFTPDEIRFCMGRCKAIESFSTTFAVKEATFKAFSIKGKGLMLRSVEVCHFENGKPFVKLDDVALSIALSEFSVDSFKIEISVSDEIPYACAFAVVHSG
jgi:holo-[acyl-carrier protein] synthase